MKLYNEEPHNVYTLPNIIGMISQGGWDGRAM